MTGCGEKILRSAQNDRKEYETGGKILRLRLRMTMGGTE